MCGVVVFDILGRGGEGRGREERGGEGMEREGEGSGGDGKEASSIRVQCVSSLQWD